MWLNGRGNPCVKPANCCMYCSYILPPAIHACICHTVTRIFTHRIFTTVFSGLLYTEGKKYFWYSLSYLIKNVADLSNSQLLAIASKVANVADLSNSQLLAIATKVGQLCSLYRVPWGELRCGFLIPFSSRFTHLRELLIGLITLAPHINIGATRVLQISESLRLFFPFSINGQRGIFHISVGQDCWSVHTVFHRLCWIMWKVKGSVLTWSH